MSEERKAAERLAVKGLGAVILTGLCFWLIPLMWDKLSVFIIAIPLAAMLQPVIRFAAEKLKMKRGVSVLICVLLLLAFLFGAMYWGVSIVLEQAPQVVGQSGTLIGDAVTTIQQAMDNLIHNTSNNFSPQVQQRLGIAGRLGRGFLCRQPGHQPALRRHLYELPGHGSLFHLDPLQ